MTKQVRVILDGVEAVARLHEDAAPQTVARFWAALPIEAVLRHVRWSGEAGYILISQLADKTQPLENAISFYPPGSIAFRAEHGETAFSYGQAQARDHAHVATWACHLGTLETNIDAFLAKVAADAERGRQADAPSARGGAVKRVEVEIDGVVAQTELNEAGAPRATAALWNALPIEARLEHAKWSGRACGVSAAGPRRRGRIGASGVLDISGHPPRRPDRSEVLMSHGAAEYRSVLGVEYGTQLGRLVGNRDVLLAVLARMHDEGDKRIVIRRTAAA